MLAWIYMRIIVFFSTCYARDVSWYMTPCMFTKPWCELPALLQLPTTICFPCWKSVVASPLSQPCNWKHMYRVIEWPAWPALATCISWRFGASIAANVADELGVTTKMAFGISGTAQQQKCSRLMRVCCASIGITERVMFFNIILKKGQYRIFKWRHY